ncbi:MAG: hypothetical protein R3C68_04060 [Myxococcota bacterium]
MNRQWVELRVEENTMTSILQHRFSCTSSKSSGKYPELNDAQRQGRNQKVQEAISVLCDGVKLVDIVFTPQQAEFLARINAQSADTLFDAREIAALKNKFKITDESITANFAKSFRPSTPPNGAGPISSYTSDQVAEKLEVNQLRNGGLSQLIDQAAKKRDQAAYDNLNNAFDVLGRSGVEPKDLPINESQAEFVRSLVDTGQIPNAQNYAGAQ